MAELSECALFAESIVFHGWNADSFCALAAFLEMGVEGSWITLIEPPTASSDIFNDDRQVSFQAADALAQVLCLLEKGLGTCHGRFC